MSEALAKVKQMRAQVLGEPKSMFTELQSRDPALLKLLQEINRVFGKTKREIRLNEVKQEEA